MDGSLYRGILRCPSVQKRKGYYEKEINILVPKAGRIFLGRRDRGSYSFLAEKEGSILGREWRSPSFKTRKKKRKKNLSSDLTSRGYSLNTSAREGKREAAKDFSPGGEKKKKKSLEARRGGGGRLLALMEGEEGIGWTCWSLLLRGKKEGGRPSVQEEKRILRGGAEIFTPSSSRGRGGESHLHIPQRRKAYAHYFFREKEKV